MSQTFFSVSAGSYPGPLATPFCASRAEKSTPETHEYRLYAEGESTNPSKRNPTSDGKWTLRLGIHNGGLMSRDHAPAQFGKTSFAQCQEALLAEIRSFAGLWCFIWFAEAIAPDGTVHKLLNGAPYAS